MTLWAVSDGGDLWYTGAKWTTETKWRYEGSEEEAARMARRLATFEGRILYLVAIKPGTPRKEIHPMEVRRS